MQKLMRGYAGLPRGKIGIRSVHHIFNPEGEPEEADDVDRLMRAGH